MLTRSIAACLLLFSWTGLLRGDRPNIVFLMSDDQCSYSLAVVSKEMKYIFWAYGGGGMTPTEELYDTQRDLLELTNLARNARYADKLQAMRTRYDSAVAHWQHESVDYTNDREFGLFFDRQTPWSEKAKKQKTRKGLHGLIRSFIEASCTYVTPTPCFAMICATSRAVTDLP